jgi:hypothetical protein
MGIHSKLPTEGIGRLRILPADFPVIQTVHFQDFPSSQSIRKPFSLEQRGRE